MLDPAGLLLKYLVTSYVNESAENARSYIADFDNDKELFPDMEYDTLYKCYKKLSDVEIKMLTATILQGFIRQTVYDIDYGDCLDGITKSIETETGQLNSNQ